MEKKITDVQDQIIANQVAGMPLEEAIFQAGYTAGVDAERGRKGGLPITEPILTDDDVKAWEEMNKEERVQGAVWVNIEDNLPPTGETVLVEYRSGDYERMKYIGPEDWWKRNVKRWLDESAGEKEVDADELWDEFSEHIDDDIDSLSRIAGSSVMTKEGFKKMMGRMR